MSGMPSNAICAAIGEAAINQMFGLMMDNMVIELDQDHPQGDSAGFELKSLTARFKPSITDAPHGRYGARPLVFDSAQGRIHLHELDLKWDKFDIAMAIKLKERDITVFGKTLHLFAGSPQLDFVVSLAKFIRRSEVDVHVAPEIRHTPPQQKDGKPIPETEAWAIGFREAMVQFDIFDLEGIFEDVVVDALKHALADAIAGHSSAVDILATVHMADPVFEVQNSGLPLHQRWNKARQLAITDLRGLIDNAEHLAELLDLPDDLVKWVYDRFHKNLDLVSWLGEVLARFLKEKLTCPLPSSIPIPPPADLAAKFPGLRLLPLQLPIRNPVLLITDELLVQLEPGTMQDLRE